MKKVTVYIPCYNAEEFIPGCLEAVFSQSFPPEEVIIVNDGSADRTVEFSKRFPVKIINLPSHPGLASARNAAIKAARYPYIASLDADCIPDPTWLERLEKTIRDTGAAGAGGKLVEAHQDTMANRWRAAHMRQNWGDKRIVNPPFLFGCNTLFRKEALEDAGLYDPRCRSNGEDVDISHRLRAKGYSLIYEPSAVLRHLKRDTFISVLRADWNWGYITSGDTEKFKKNSNIVYHNFTNAKYRFLKDLSPGRRSLLAVDVMLFFYHTYLDIAHTRKAGVKGEHSTGLSSRIGTLTGFHSHLARMSESRFLQTPDSFDTRKGEKSGQTAKILFALFGALGDIFNGLPVVQALKEKYPEAELTWLTLQCYREIAESSPADRVLTHGRGRHGEGIPWELLESEHFDLVFFPQGSFNHDEWERSGLHMVDFMARKCGVEVSSRAPEVTIGPQSREDVNSLWKKHGLAGKTVIAMACSALSCKPWPRNNFEEIAWTLGRLKNTALLHIGSGEDAPLPGAIDCRDIPFSTSIEIIRQCDLFIGCDSGPTWMASCTDTPIIVFMDSERQKHYNVGFKCVMPEKDITELSVEATVGEAMDSITHLMDRLQADRVSQFPENNML